MIIRTILVAAAALASASLSPGHAEAAQAPWCAQIDLGTGDWYWDCQYHSFEDCSTEAIFWQAIEAFALRAHTTSPDPRNRPGNVLACTNRNAPA
jgi:hypothetical protein